MATPDLSKMDVDDLASELMAAAEKIYDTYMDEDTPLHQKDYTRQRLRDHITLVKAELSRRMTPPPGCVRPVVGKTADGVEVRVGDPVWLWGDPKTTWYASHGGGAHRDRGWTSSLSSAYSTPEAAKQAAEAARSSKA